MRLLSYTLAIFPANFGFVGVLLDEPEMRTQAGTPLEVRKAMSQALQILHETQPWMDGPQARDFVVHSIPVSLRPEYQVGTQVQTSERILNFRFPCAVGEMDGGLKMCVVPSLGIQFCFEEDRSLRELVGHYVQEKLAKKTPRELVRHSPPESLELEECRVKTARRPEPGDRLDLEKLEAVAEPAHQLKSKSYGREEALSSLLESLQAGLSVALVGPPSVGKTALLAEAARRLQKRRPKGENRRAPRLWRTSAARIVAGMSFLGMWEQRCERVIEELEMAGAILAVDSVAELIRQGGREPASSIAAFLAPYVMEAKLQLVVEASPAEWQACRRLLPGFADLFRTLHLEPMGDAETLEVLAWVRGGLCQSRGLHIPAGVDGVLLSLFRRFSPYAALPGSAARFLRRKGEAAPRGSELDSTRLIEAFSTESGVAEHFLRDDVPLAPEDVESQLRQRIVAQPQAVEAALRIVTAFKAGLQDPQRPLGVLLLCGPTGVGKTELAKALAEVMFGEEKRLIRLDMSEYSNPGSAERLLGSLYDKAPAPWLRQLRQQPFSVVLFDEVEKAHPEVFDVLMRAFDEGHLTDPWGRRTSLLTSVLLLTSNLGADQQNHVGLTPGKSPGYSQAVYQFFRPELINRLDAVVPFHSLSPEMVRSVAAKEFRELEKRPGLRRRGVKLKPTEAALEHLAQLGYDARLGARPLQRMIEKQIIPPLARYLRERSSIGERVTVTLEVDYGGEEGFTIGPLR